jgi:hypothetical protein
MVVLSSGARLAKGSNREGAFRSRKGTHCLGAIEFASSSDGITDKQRREGLMQSSPSPLSPLSNSGL